MDTMMISKESDNTCKFNPAQKTITETEYYYNYGSRQIKSQKIQKFDDQGNLIQTKTISPGGIGSVPNITITEGDAIQQAQYSLIDPNSGNIVISKELVSPDNVKSKYYIEQTPDGDLILNYRITKPAEPGDKNDKETVLLDRNLCFRQLSENKFLTAINNVNYELEVNGCVFTITNLTNGDKKELNIDIIAEDEISQNLAAKILRQIPANILMSINHDDFQFKYNDNITNNAQCNPIPNACMIEMGDLLSSDADKNNNIVSVFLHEYGHRLDCDMSSAEETNDRYYLISQDKYLNEIYEKELETYWKNTDGSTQYSASYIANDLVEMVAETNLILNGIPHLIGTNRITVIQEYFPETIARIAELLDKRIDELTKKTQ